jgi:hypothetical protein
MHFILSQDEGELEVWLDPQPHLEGVEEIRKSRHHHRFQNLLLCETMSSEPIYVLTAKLQRTYPKFESEV